MIDVEQLNDMTQLRSACFMTAFTVAIHDTIARPTQGLPARGHEKEIL